MTIRTITYAKPKPALATATPAALARAPSESPPRPLVTENPRITAAPHVSIRRAAFSPSSSRPLPRLAAQPVRSARLLDALGKVGGAPA